MNQLLSLVIICLFITTACSDYEKNSYVNHLAQLAEIHSNQIVVEAISIPIDSITSSSYPVYHNALINGDSYLAGYNHKTHNIDVFDLNSESFYKRINLEYQGPNGIEDVSGLYIHNWDSIFISATFNIYLINCSGQIIKSFAILDETIFTNEEEGILTSTISFGLQYSQAKNSVFLNYIPKGTEFGTREFFSKPFIAEYFLNNSSVNLITIPYSKYFSNNNVGFLSEPGVSVFDSTIYVCFQGESNIYSYNTETEKINIHGGSSKFSKNVAPPVAPNAKFHTKLKHRLEGPMFFKMVYDPYRELFYRLHFGDMVSQKSENNRDAFLDKKLYLMIFNKDLELIEELKLEDHTYIPDFYGISNEGLILNSNHSLNTNFSGNYANFQVIKVNIAY